MTHLISTPVSPVLSQLGFPALPLRRPRLKLSFKARSQCCSLCQPGPHAAEGMHISSRSRL